MLSPMGVNPETDQAYICALILILVWTIPVYMLIRVHTVSHVRNYFLNKNYRIYNNLPSHDKMMFQIRYWTIKQYAKKYGKDNDNFA